MRGTWGLILIDRAPTETESPLEDQRRLVLRPPMLAARSLGELRYRIRWKRDVERHVVGIVRPLGLVW